MSQKAGLKEIYGVGKTHKEINEENKKRKEAYEKVKANHGIKSSVVDDDYINNYIEDCNNFSKTVQTDFDNVGYNNSQSSYRNYLRKSEILSHRANKISDYLKANKNKYDIETYNDLMSYLDNGKKSFTTAIQSFSKAKDYYSQWETEEDYTGYLQGQKEREKMLSFDTEKGRKEVSDIDRQITALKNEISTKRALYNSRYGNGNAVNYGPNNGISSVSSFAPISQSREMAKIEKEIADYEKKLSDLESQKTEKYTYYNQAKNLQENKALTENAMNAEDFELYSEKGVNNKITQTKDKFSSTDSFGEDATLTRNQRFAKYLTDDELNVYEYYIGKGDTQSAEAYLNSMEETVNGRKGLEIYDLVEDKTALELAFGVAAGLDQFGSGIKTSVGSLFGGKNYYAASAIQQASGLIREGLSDEGFKIGDNSLAQIGYDFVTTTSNMLPSVLTSAVAGVVGNAIAPGVGTAVAPAIGSALLGASAAGNAYAEMINLGYDKGQARAYGAMVGASEAGLQLVLGGVGKLGGYATKGLTTKLVGSIDNALAKGAIKFGGKMISEGFEEYMQEILDPFFKNVAFNEKNEVKLYTSEALYSGVLGALTASVLDSGPSSVTNTVKTYTEGKKALDRGAEISRLKELGQTFSADSVAYKIADKVNKDTGAYTIGKLLNEVGAELTQQNQTEVANALVEKGVAPKNAESISKWLSQTVDGAKLTEFQAYVLENNEVVSDVFRDVIVDKNSTFNQRRQNFFETAKLDGYVGENVNTQTTDDALARYNAKYVLSQEMTKDALSQTDTEQRLRTSAQSDFDMAVLNLANETVSKGKTATQQSAYQMYADPVARVKAATVPTRNIKPREHDVSAEGKTILNTKNGAEDVEIKGVALTKGKEMTLELTDGRKVSSKDIEYSTEDEAIVYETVANMEVPTGVADVLIKNYSPKQSGSVYAFGVEEAYKYGYFNYSVDELRSRSSFALKLTEEQRNTAYNLGKAMAEADVKAAEKANEGRGRSKGKGKVYFKGTRRGLQPIQKTSLKALEVLAEATGLQIEVFESKVVNGRRVGENGSYNPETSKMRIDLYAGKDGKGLMLFTAAHELVHHIKDWSPEKYKILADFLMEQYGKKGVSVDELVQRQIGKAESLGKKLTYERAHEEVVADSMETMLADGTIIEKLRIFSVKDKSIVAKIESFLKNLVAKIRKTYEGLRPDSQEGRIVAEMVDTSEQLHQLFADAIADASENFKSAEVVSVENTSQGNEVRYSISTDRQGRYVKVDVNQDVFDGKNTREMQEIARKLIKENFKGKVLSVGTDGKAYINKRSAEEYAYPANRRMDDTIKEAKMRSSAELDNLLAISEFVENQPDDGRHPQATGGWDVYTTRFEVASKMFIGEVKIMVTDRGYVFYDITKIKRLPVNGGQTETSSVAASGNPSNDIISNSVKNVNTSISENDVKYSDRDSKGRKLSAEQLEYFKKSKVRDENGNLLVVYHGTPESFTVFRNRGSGMYFTADPDYAYGYTQLRGKVMEQYINITKPFDILNDEDAKNIFVNEFIKGGYAQGINPSSSAKQIDEYIKNGVDWVEGDNLIEFLEENEYDYDGLILNEGSDSVTTQNGAQVNWRGFSYVIFEPNQTKNVDNLNPTKDNDIRYSDRDPDALTPRNLLANALEESATNETEKKKLAEYKENIGKLYEKEQELYEVRKEINGIYTTKGPRDMPRLKQLQKRATELSNNITVYDKKLLNLESTSFLKNVLEREKTKAIKRQKERYRESRKKAVERRNRTVMRNKIKRVVKELNQYLLHGTKDKHVMDDMKKVVAEALNIIDMDTVGADERVERYNQLIAEATDPDIIASLTETRDRIQGQGDNLNEKLMSLKNAYADIINSTDPVIANAYDKVIEDKILSVAQSIEGTSLRNMSISQLEEVYDLYKMVLTNIRDSNKAFKAGKDETISELGYKVNSEVEGVTEQKYKISAFKDYISKFGWNELKPIYAFRMIGSDTFQRLFKNILRGQDTWYRDVEEGKTFQQQVKKKYGYNKWDFKKNYTFTAKNGNNFDLTLQQIMSLYAFSRREQALNHLIQGGIVFDRDVKVTEKVKGIPVSYKVNTTDAFNLSPEIIGEIVDSLTAEQKSFVEEMQSFLSDVMGEKGNEISLAMYGIKLYKEKFYFPLKSSEYYMNFTADEAGEVKLKNSGFSKETVKRANNPIVLSDFMDVWAKHVNEMSTYHAFVLPIEDFSRVYNYRTPSSESSTTQSLKNTLNNAFGSGVNKYIRQMLVDINGGARSGLESHTDKITSLAKKGAVTMSASVVIQQPSAIARAMAYIKPKYFATVESFKFAKHNEKWQELKKYAPVAGIKEMGYFDTGMGRSSTDWLVEEDYDGIREKLYAFFHDKDARKTLTDDFLGKAPSMADELSWVAMWEAVKKETKKETEGLDPNSEEFLERCGERFTEVVELTQVYDSVLSRSGYMRDKGGLMKMATSFMAEPTVQANMLIDVCVQGKRKGKVGVRFASGVISSVIGSIILNTLLKSIVYAARDDDEEKTQWEKYLSSVVGDLTQSLNPLTMIPFTKDIVSIFSGYDVERMDMSLVTDLKDSIMAIGSDTKTTSDKIHGLVGSIGQLLGIPAKNVIRDVKAVVNTVMALSKGTETTKLGAEFALKDEVNSTITGNLLDKVFDVSFDTSKHRKYYDAVMAGDKVYAERMESLFKNPKTDIVKSLKDYEPRILKAAQAEINGKPNERYKIAKEIVADGFKQDYVVSAIQGKVNQLTKKDSDSSSTKEKSLSSIDNYFASAQSGETSSAKTHKEAIIQTDMNNSGKTYEEAEKSFFNKFYGTVEDAIGLKTITVEKAAQMLEQFGNLDSESAQEKAQHYVFKRDNPDVEYKWKESTSAKYYEVAEPAGISVEVYDEYLVSVAECKGTDSDNDGKADSGTVKKQKLEVIDSLDLTDYQKDVLYRINGWSDSTLWQAPWH